MTKFLQFLTASFAILTSAACTMVNGPSEVETAKLLNTDSNTTGAHLSFDTDKDGKADHYGIYTARHPGSYRCPFDKEFIAAKGLTSCVEAKIREDFARLAGLAFTVHANDEEPLTDTQTRNPATKAVTVLGQNVPLHRIK